MIKYPLSYTKITQKKWRGGGDEKWRSGEVEKWRRWAGTAGRKQAGVHVLSVNSVNPVISVGSVLSVKKKQAAREGSPVF